MGRFRGQRQRVASSVDAVIVKEKGVGVVEGRGK